MRYEKEKWDLGMVLLLLSVMLSLLACSGKNMRTSTDEKDAWPSYHDTMVERDSNPMVKIHKTEAEWKAELDAAAYYVLRQKGTERAFTGKYWDSKEKGVYTCGGCGLSLFHSDTKYKSGTGWPSYYAPIAPGHLREVEDYSLGMSRREVVCARCDGHLGHVFSDGPAPTGLRYCINSVALGFEADTP